MSVYTSHIVSCTFPATGHLRPTIALVTRLVSTYPGLLVTLFILYPRVPEVQRELARTGLAEEIISRIRVIGVSKVDPGAGHDALAIAAKELVDHTPPAYQTLISGGKLTCTWTGNVYDYAAAPRPTVAFNDLLSPDIGRAFKEITPDVKVYVLWMTIGATFLRWCGPKDMGGLLGWREEAIALTRSKPNMTFEDAAHFVECDYSGSVLPHPEGKHLMYNYEIFPQDMPQAHMLPVHMKCFEFPTSEHCDGVVFSLHQEFEPKTSETLRTWYGGQLRKDIFYVGAPAAQLGSIDTSPGTADVEKFLEIFEFLNKQPRQSVWLISFGTVFYPFLHPDHVDILLKTLIKNNVPFIFVRASVMSGLAPLSEEIKQAVAKSRIGLIMDYIPQRPVLHHPSICTFVQHGGSNSMLESIESGVVPIFWPFTVDQPFTAAHMTLVRDCSFELIQVRTGKGAGPLLRGGVVKGTPEAISDEIETIITSLKGDVGKRKRRNLDGVRTELVNSLKAGGSSAQDTIKLMEAVGAAPAPSTALWPTLFLLRWCYAIIAYVRNYFY